LSVTSPGDSVIIRNEVRLTYNLSPFIPWIGDSRREYRHCLDEALSAD
jgi:hypothetical protein